MNALARPAEVALAAAPVAAAGALTLIGSITPSTPSTPASELFGSFFLGDDEFALPASSIREVVNYPQKVTPMPLAPRFLEGVFTLRGSVIPVLNLARIFDPAALTAQPSHKIAIVDHGDIQVGLVFHATGEILRVRPEQRSLLEYRDGASHNVINGAIRLNDGARLLQVLDPAALISIENVPQVLALKSTGRNVETSHFHLQAERRQCVAFKVGGNAFAFEMSGIREIIDVPELKSSVLNSKLCIGRINLRGRTVAVVDFARLLQVDAGEATGATGATAEHAAGALADGARRIVIARIGDASIGLLVDSVDNVFSFFPGDVLPIPLLGKTRAGMFGGCIQKEGFDPILFLNHEEIFSSSEITAITRGHAELYAQDGAADGAQPGAGSAANPASGATSNAVSDSAAASHGATGARAANIRRTVYITFTVGNAYALEIRKIREIIDLAPDLIKPPGMPAFVEGVLNLRRQMVTVLNLRSLYGMPALAEPLQRKIMVIEHGDERYGLMVDAVENIITVADKDRLPAPRMLRRADHAEAAGLRGQVEEVIELNPPGQGHQTLSVFEIERFLERVGQELQAAAL